MNESFRNGLMEFSFDPFYPLVQFLEIEWSFYFLKNSDLVRTHQWLPFRSIFFDAPAMECPVTVHHQKLLSEYFPVRSPPVI